MWCDGRLARRGHGEGCGEFNTELAATQLLATADGRNPANQSRLVVYSCLFH